MTEEQIDRRDYGRLEAQVERLSKDVHELKMTVETMRDLLQQATGGWKLLLAVGGASGTGITIATVKTAIVECDGTNVLRVTADV